MTGDSRGPIARVLRGLLAEAWTWMVSLLLFLAAMAVGGLAADSLLWGALAGLGLVLAVFLVVRFARKLE